MFALKIPFLKQRPSGPATLPTLQNKLGSKHDHQTLGLKVKGLDSSHVQNRASYNTNRDCPSLQV